MTIYRHHRGSLAESMATCVEINSIDELASLLDVYPEAITVRDYGYDRRIDWITFIVCVNGNAVGFTDGPLNCQAGSMADHKVSILGIRMKASYELTRPKYYELVDALVGMACQYLENVDGRLCDGGVSAGEIAIDSLENLGLVKDKKIIPEAYNYEYLKNRFPT